MSAHLVHMAGMGLVVSAAAPLAVLLLVRALPRAERLVLPGSIALPGFVALHAAITVVGHAHGSAAHAAAPVVLLLAGTFFWAPVLGRRRRLSDPLRVVYLYAAMPLLDMAGVWLVAAGDTSGGLAMIVGMLPMGCATVVLTCQWINREERDTAHEEAGRTRSPLADGDHDGAEVA